MVNIPITVFVFVFLTNFCLCSTDELSAVVVIFRHGDRTPTKPYPTDPYKNRSYWPVDFGQLTNIGKRQQFELGQWLRKRYESFLPLEYNEKDVIVISTDVDRTLMSAEANLAGLYPPLNDQVWNKDINWQPIPVHTLPESSDNILAAKKNCPKYNKLFSDLMSADYFRNISRQNHDLYAYLTRYSGEIINNLDAVEYLYSTFFIESLYNLTLPDWALKVYPEKLKPLAFLSFATPTYTPQLARLKVGPLFQEIIEYFQSKTHGTDSLPKLIILSAHDSTIANVLNSVGAFEYHVPPYASTIIFELRKRYDEGSYVNIFYKNTTEAREVSVRGCDLDCDINDFAKILEPITVSAKQWEKECKLGRHWSPIFQTQDHSSRRTLSGLMQRLVNRTPERIYSFRKLFCSFLKSRYPAAIQLSPNCKKYDL